MNRTLEALISSGGNRGEIRDKLIRNLSTKESVNKVLNLVQITYDFDDSLVTISYYVEDELYPDVVLSFGEFRTLLD